ncbi:hypothetical protein ACFXP3_10350 [Streptomyces sp. NPDC059096]|uniref:hypothetical protein n=1 Tax=Streptomyces sp. NPDC059096 TaxID=3346727 RepID=UPI00368DB045
MPLHKDDFTRWVKERLYAEYGEHDDWPTHLGLASETLFTLQRHLDIGVFETLLRCAGEAVVEQRQVLERDARLRSFLKEAGAAPGA